MSSSRLSAPARLVAAGRNPELALRLLATVPEALRGELLRRWSLPLQPSEAARPAPARPGLKKCSAPLVADAPAAARAQLAAFARSVGRVG